MSYRKFHSGLLYEYESVEDIFGGKPINFYTMPEQVDGTGFVVYDRSMFFTPVRRCSCFIRLRDVIMNSRFAETMRCVF